MQNKEKQLEKKITILNEALLTGASANSLAKKYGMDHSQIAVWLRKQETIVQECLVYVKLADEGKFQILLEKNGMAKDENKKTLKDYKRENEYLKTKLAYYEELAKQDGVDLTNPSKKNGTGQSVQSENVVLQTSGSSVP